MIMINNKLIENSVQEICDQIELSYDNILNSIDQLLIPQQNWQLIMNHSILDPISKVRPLLLSFSNEIIEEITTLIDQFILLKNQKQEQQGLEQIKKSTLLLLDTHNLLQQKDQEIQQSHQPQSGIIKMENNKLNEVIKENQEIIIQTQPLQKLIVLNSFTFSETYKNTCCQVSENGMLYYNKSLFYTCFCDQVIPNKGIVRFGYLILDTVTNKTMVGIGARDMISQKGYSNIQDPGRGAYLIMSSGYCFSHHQKEKYHNQIPFTFNSNDIIIVEVEIQNKYIKWIKQSTKQSFLLEIDPHYEYYPCINGPGKVQILNEIPS